MVLYFEVFPQQTGFTSQKILSTSLSWDIWGNNMQLSHCTGHRQPQWFARNKETDETELRQHTVRGARGGSFHSPHTEMQRYLLLGRINVSVTSVLGRSWLRYEGSMSSRWTPVYFQTSTISHVYLKCAGSSGTENVFRSYTETDMRRRNVSWLPGESSDSSPLNLNLGGLGYNVRTKKMSCQCQGYRE